MELAEHHRDFKRFSFLSMFTNPSTTFASLRAKPKWFYPTAFSALASVACNYYVIHRIGLARIVESALDGKHVVDPQGAIQNVLSHRGIVLAVQSASIFINVFVIALVTATVLWLLLTACGHDISLRKALSVVAHANMLSVVIKSSMIVLTIAALRDVSAFDLRNPLATNMAFFLKPSSPEAFHILVSLDAIKIMNLALLIIGFSRICQALSTGRAALLVLIPWVIYRAISFYVPLFR